MRVRDASRNGATEKGRAIVIGMLGLYRARQLYKLRKTSCFVSGHGFSRGVPDLSNEGFSPWGIAARPVQNFLAACLVRVAKFDTGSGATWYSHMRNERGLCRAPARRGSPIGSPALHPVLPLARFLPEEARPSSPRDQPESPGFAPDSSVSALPPQ